MQGSLHEGGLREDRLALDREGRMDPVCGMTVSERSPYRLHLGEEEFRFCSAHCLERFARHPEAFLEADADR